MPGRKPEEAPDGYMSVAEAAKALGVSQTAVRARLERGTLDGTTYQRATSAGNYEPRHAVLEEAVERELSRRSDIARREDITTEVEIHGQEVRELSQRIIDAIQENRQSVTGEIARQREEFVAAVRKVAEDLEQRAEEEKQHQEKVREHERRVIELMESERTRTNLRPWMVVTAFIVVLLAAAVALLIFILLNL